jgi:D-alanyl-D-alanine carboxypeptidase/D-alanyl-D-alanine-endopeptidase (penicillin-binding protein 4)
MKLTVIFILAVILLDSCSARINFRSELSMAEKRFKDNTGFMLYDPATRKTIYEYNAGHYFTPASNTKILTLYTALHILGDSVPAFNYIVKNDSLFIWGTGDPSFLYKNVFDNRRAYNFLQQNPHKLFISFSHFRTDSWGPGWAWDDYPFSFSAERTPFPVFGNIEHIKKHGDHFTVTPVLFQNHFVKGDSVDGDSKIIREIDSNQITWFPGTKQEPDKIWELPFHYSPDLLVELLSDTLKRQVDELDGKKPSGTLTLFSLPSDSLYSVMMKFSDNLIAEQLLLQCADKISDTLNTEIAIRYAKKKLFADLPDELIWVDGSGLSRYNLTTPRNIVRLWEKLFSEVPKERLFRLLSVGGQKGTLKNYYATNPPFIFGKTGALSNHLALSGYLITKKGKILIFCFMNGNFVAPAKEIGLMMQRILSNVRDHY